MWPVDYSCRWWLTMTPKQEWNHSMEIKSFHSPTPSIQTASCLRIKSKALTLAYWHLWWVSRWPHLLHLSPFLCRHSGFTVPWICLDLGISKARSLTPVSGSPTESALTPCLKWLSPHNPEHFILHFAYLCSANLKWNIGYLYVCLFIACCLPSTLHTYIGIYAPWK